MRKSALGTVLDPFLLLFDIAWIPRAMLQAIHGAIAKETIKIFQSLMTGKILAVPVFKKTM